MSPYSTLACLGIMGEMSSSRPGKDLDDLVEANARIGPSGFRLSHRHPTTNVTAALVGRRLVYLASDKEDLFLKLLQLVEEDPEVVMNPVSPMVGDKA